MQTVAQRSTEHTTLKIAYLFWECELNFVLPILVHRPSNIDINELQTQLVSNKTYVAKRFWTQRTLSPFWTIRSSARNANMHCLSL